MKTVSSKVSEVERKAILEYANECGLTISELIKKVLGYEMCFLGGDCPPEAAHYLFHLDFSDERDEETAFLNHVNKYRKIFGISPLQRA